MSFPRNSVHEGVCYPVTIGESNGPNPADKISNIFNQGLDLLWLLSLAKNRIYGT